MAGLQAFLNTHGITQTELGDALGMTGASISRKLSGARNWKGREIGMTLQFLSERLSRRVTYEEVFGDPKLVAAAEGGS